jgi:hypothetical protein
MNYASKTDAKKSKIKTIWLRWLKVMSNTIVKKYYDQKLDLIKIYSELVFVVTEVRIGSIRLG